MNKKTIIITLLLILITLSGCKKEELPETPPQVLCPDCPVCYGEEPEIIYVNQTVLVNNTCGDIYNITYNSTEVIYIDRANSSVITHLIRRIEWYEEREEMYLNQSWDNWKWKYLECNETLTDLKEVLE